MRMKQVFLMVILITVVALLLIIVPEVEAQDETNNGDPLPTTVWMAGDGDDVDLTLWPIPPTPKDQGYHTRVVVDVGPLSQPTDAGTWNSSMALDKDLTVDGEVTIILWVNSSTDSGPLVTFTVNIFGQNFQSNEVSTNTGLVRVEITGTVNDYHIQEDELLTMNIQVDGQKDTTPGSGDVILHSFNTTYPARVEFFSDATEIQMEWNQRPDDDGVKYYEIFVNITDAFEDWRLDKKSFVMNITSKDDPVNYTDEVHGHNTESDYIHASVAEYWGTIGYTAIKYEWYYEGRTYSNDVEGQAIQPGDFWFNFTLRDVDLNVRYFYHLQQGINPTYVHVNVQTRDDYITIVDEEGKTVDEVAEHDKVKVRAYIAINKGRSGHIYNFYVELRENGVLIENGRQYVQMEGLTSKDIFFDWDPVEGDRELRFKVDSDNDIDEIDEGDNTGVKDLYVIEEAAPTVVISNPVNDSYINEDIYILFDASESTNPLGGDMTFEWTIYKKDGPDWISKDSLTGESVQATKLYKKFYGAGTYKAVVEVSNDKRTTTEEVIFHINSIPIIRLDSPENNSVHSTNEEILFDASQSEDGDGDTLYFYWISDVKDDGVLNRNGGGSVDYTMDYFFKKLNGGTHHITLEVTDYDPDDPPKDGKRGFSSEIVTIIVNTPPEIEITTPTEGSSYSAKSPVLFDASRTSDPDGDDMTFAWYDGNRFMDNKMKFNETLSSGPHEIRLEVTDGYSVSEMTRNITVGAPPTASTDTSKKAELKDGKAKVKLDASASTPSDESVPIVRYIWDMDADVDSDTDGISDNDEDYVETEPIVELVYTEKGTYTAVLVVEDNAGMRSQPFLITVSIEKEDEDDEFPIAIVGGAVAAAAVVIIVVVIFIQRREEEEEEEEEEYEEGMYAEAEYEEAEYDEAEYY